MTGVRDRADRISPAHEIHLVSPTELHMVLHSHYFTLVDDILILYCYIIISD